MSAEDRLLEVWGTLETEEQWRFDAWKRSKERLLEFLPKLLALPGLEDHKIGGAIAQDQFPIICVSLPGTRIEIMSSVWEGAFLFFHSTTCAVYVYAEYVDEETCLQYLQTLLRSN